MLAMSTSILAVACGAAEPSELSEAEPAAAPEAPPTVSGLSEEELDILASAFEADPDWNRDEGTVAPVSVALVRNDLRRAVNEVWGEISGNPNKYFGWARDEDSFDYFHLVSVGPALESGRGPVPTSADGAEFDLTASVLRRMAEANYFRFDHDQEPADSDRRIIFGLRGCEIVSGSQSFSTGARLRDVRPDHRRRRCVIGVWDPATDQVAVFESSTVPLELHKAIYQQWVRGGMSVRGSWRACMVPQGLHRRTVGLMFADRALSGQWPLTLRQDPSPVPVLRSPEGDAFTWRRGQIADEDGRVRQSASQWDPSRASERIASVGAHIHAAAYGGTELQFSSQGCQTIQGNFRNGKADGHYALFHQAMGFGPVTEGAVTRSDGSSAPVYQSEKDGRSYPFMLLTGAEARLHAQGADFDALRRVRLGSSSPPDASERHIVRQLKRRIGGDQGAPLMTASDMLRLIEQQSSLSFEGLAPDGILCPHHAEVFGDLQFL
ncbi:hypothetical protein [Hyphomonas sp.]|uniref:hypothetical protein n=1 Tax=Hyphomonas sp. TaxID=87 RepID=UPI00391B96C3